MLYRIFHILNLIWQLKYLIVCLIYHRDIPNTHIALRKAHKWCRGRRVRYRMVVGFTTTYAISTYHHKRCEFESCTWQGVLDTTLCDKVCRWISLGTAVSSTNKTARHDITGNRNISRKYSLNLVVLKSRGQIPKTFIKSQGSTNIALRTEHKCCTLLALNGQFKMLE
jgi:hypothetical protein